MLKMPASRPVAAHIRRSFQNYLKDESGAMAIFAIFIFFLMMVFGGIAVDVMRMESRRVAMVQTLDRAVLAASSLTQEQSPKAVAEEWFAKAGLSDHMAVDFSDPVITVEDSPVQRKVTGRAKVRSYNWFMGMGFMPVDYLEAPSMARAEQGISEIEVMLVLDITGSMNSPATTGTTTKIADLRLYAQEFVDIVKVNDKKNGVSIGMVPYAAQVNIPKNLREQFAVTNVSHWGGLPSQGVPNINCIEMPTSSYGSTGLPTDVAMPMAAVADANSTFSNTSNYRAPTSANGALPVANTRICTTRADSGTTAYNDEEVNHVLLPTKDGSIVKTRIQRLVADGNTSIALGMRWGTALIDESARPIYTAIGDATVQGRPADNPGIDPTVLAQTKKIIILMTDGSHVANTHIRDAYKTGLSPIYLGADGNYAVRFPTFENRPGSAASFTCSGWVLANGAARSFFVPHMKRNSVQQNTGTQPEGVGTGANIAGACDPRSWIAQPANATTEWWTGSGTTLRQLDWSEVWAAVRVSYVARQWFMRSGVTGTSDYNALMDTFRTTYLAVNTMNSLLQQNCTAAKNQGIIIYGIAFAAPAAGAIQIQNCSTEADTSTNYFFDAQNGDDLRSAFQLIATDISDLRLTQ